MPVKFKKSDVFKTEVTFPEPNDAGGFDDSTFVGHFKRPTHQQAIELRKKDDVEVVRQQLVGWDMVDEAGAAVPYSDDAREVVMSSASAPYHTALAFYRAVSGNKTKNS